MIIERKAETTEDKRALLCNIHVLFFIRNWFIRSSAQLLRVKKFSNGFLRPKKVS